MNKVLNIAVLLLGIFFISNIIEFPHKESEYQEYDMGQVVPIHDLNICQSEPFGEMFSEQITVNYPPREPTGEDGRYVIGQWNPLTNTISLMQPDGLTIQTVAHEVSHMVDTFMVRYDIQDPHFEAYLQGFWTECVYQILQEDIKNAV